VHQKASIKQKKLFQFVIKILRVVTLAKINIPTTLSNLGIIFGWYVYCPPPYLLFTAGIVLLLLLLLLSIVLLQLWMMALAAEQYTHMNTTSSINEDLILRDF
jgi:hypothetical protein